jgi:hypothetical protein
MALHALRQSRTTSARRTLVGLLLIPLVSLVTIVGIHRQPYTRQRHS